jgi:hypothetical protein
MTMTPRCDVAPISGAMTRTDAQAVTDRMSTFLADELFPLMAGLWPASANQLDGNASGAAMAFGQMLRGFAPGQIREAVMALANEADRQFAPRPVDVRKVCVELSGCTVPAVVPCVSIRALEMQAEVMVLRGQLAREELPCYVDGLASKAAGRGHQVTGRVI